MRPTWKWSTLPPGLAIGLLIVALLLILVGPQAVAVAVTAPALFSELNLLSLFGAVPLWLTPNPTTVTGADVPALVHHLLAWGVLLMTAAIIIMVSVLLFKRRRDPQRIPGLASPFDVEKELGTKQLVKERGPKLRPYIPEGSLMPEDCGYRIGDYWGHPVWLRVEDPTIVIGPSRAGKGWYLILNWLLSAPGAVITTSSKMDNAILTMRARERLGSQVWVFAPGIAGGEALGHLLRWDPVAGCVDEETLVRRVHALIPKDAFSGSTSNGGHWDTLGQQLGAALFHAAACFGADVDKIWEWVGSPQRAQQAVQAIREHPAGLREHANFLEQVLNMPAEQRSNAWGVLPTVLAFLASGLARKWMKPIPGAEIDLVRFVLEKGTLYLVGDKQTTGGYVRIIDGLLAELDYITKGLADASRGSRLDPPITYLLDEAGNFEYQGLYELVTAGGGRGRIGVAVFQSKKQLAQWGEGNADTLWDAATAKIVLPGGANSAELKAMSELIGEQWVKREQHSWGAGPSSVSVSEEKRAVLESSAIREMKAGYGLLFYRNLKPVIPKLHPFHKHPQYPACERDGLLMAEQIRASSLFAKYLVDGDGVAFEEQLEEAKVQFA